MTDRRFAVAPLLAVSLALGAAAASAQAAPAGAIETVTLPSAGSPLVSIQLMFDAGSIHDPKGKEGLASLTAAMVGQGGTRKRSYSELLESLYPMAAAISSGADREVTVISGTVTRESLADYTALFTEALLQPAFSEADFTRNREQALTYLTNTLRSADDELLGLEAIQGEIFTGHPYSHPAAGTVEGLKSITLDDVKRFYQEHYTRANLMLGVAGGYPDGYVAGLQKTLAALPAGKPGRKELPAPRKVEGRRFVLIEKQTGSVGVHLGYPLPINRSHPDFYPLMVANSYLGEHRTSHGTLMQKLREQRGLNYGDYSYIEYWPAPPVTTHPGPGVPRRQQYFSVWLRPVVPGDAQFALRAALHEVGRLHDEGMTKEEFELTRDFVVSYSKLWAQSLSTRLGILMDSKYYGMPYWIDEIEARLSKLTVDDVNRAIRKYIHTDDYVAVMVTANAAALKETLQKDAPSPKAYNTPPAEAITAEDKKLVGLKVAPTSIEIVPVEQMFQK
ncbi:MAG TPA: pitrilysin family protein [Thermoanaerobaculia bacterium]|nr:pitrilysin family protein [Thermoanaerobaculia bacterium]